MPSWMRSPRGRPWPWYLRATEMTRRRFELIIRSLAARSPRSMRLASSTSSAAVSRGCRRASLKKSWRESSSSGALWRVSGVCAGRIRVSVVVIAPSCLIVRRLIESISLCGSRRLRQPARRACSGRLLTFRKENVRLSPPGAPSTAIGLWRYERAVGLPLALRSTAVTLRRRGQAMQVTAPGRDQLRRLAELRLDRPLVLSLYLDLDPSRFATPPARATAVRSLLDEADRTLREQHGALARRPRRAPGRPRAGPERSSSASCPPRGRTAWPCSRASRPDLFEAVKLPRSVPNRVAIGRSPLVGPLARLARRERWCVALVSRRDARIFRGSPDGLREIEQIHDTVFGQHDQGGWSQANFQRGIEKEKDDHLQAHGRRPDAPLQAPALPAPDHRRAARGDRPTSSRSSTATCGSGWPAASRWTSSSSTPHQVLAAAQPLFDELERAREAAALERLGERGAQGLEPVLRALNERRVETLLLDVQFAGSRACSVPSAAGSGPPGERCPADGTPSSSSTKTSPTPRSSSPSSRPPRCSPSARPRRAGGARRGRRAASFLGH